MLLKHFVEEKRNPVYIVRYEDMLTNKQEELEGLMKYLLDLESLEGTNV